MASSTELAAMRRAIALSALGFGSTSPNPPVGCVILDAHGQVVGQGYHRRKGEVHAEVSALAVAGSRARGGTAVVTLEPCNHHGRTPPCHRALLDAGVTRTVVAVIDPTSRGIGGVARLRQAGMEVETGALADETRLVLGPWLSGLQLGRPFVTGAGYVTSFGEHRALAAFPPAESDALLYQADAVLDEAGTIREAVPGRHGPSALTFPPGLSFAEPAAALKELYAGGVRMLLLDGLPGFAEAFAAAGLLDRLTLLIAEPDAGRAHAPLVPLLPPGFTIVRIQQRSRHALIEARS